MFDKKFRTREHVLRRFVEHKAQRADIHTVSTAFTGIQEFHIAVLVHAEFQSLRHIVHFCRYDRIGELYLLGKLLIDIQQRSSLGETLRHIIILAADL